MLQSTNAEFSRPAPLLICGFLILAGNTLFPCLLRLLIWAIRKALPDKPELRLWRQTLDLVLTQPQSVRLPLPACLQKRKLTVSVGVHFSIPSLAHLVFTWHGFDAKWRHVGGL